MLDLGVRADPAVDRYDEAGAGGGELVERLGGDAVPLREAVGQAPEHLGAHLGAQELGQQEGGGDAVGVVVAVDGDRLAAAQGAVDALAGVGHAVEQVRAMHAKVGVQEVAGDVWVGEAAPREDLGGKPADGQLVGQGGRDPQVDRRDLPGLFSRHSRSLQAARTERRGRARVYGRSSAGPPPPGVGTASVADVGAGAAASAARSRT